MALSEKVQEFVGVTPSHDKKEREDIRAEARKKVASEWFGLIMDHHELLEKAFAEVKTASDRTTRSDAQEALAILLTGHSIAEEAVIYPFMELQTSSMDSAHAYTEQAAVKIEMVALDGIEDKMSPEYDEKLEEIRKAVEHHMIEEERDYFPELQNRLDGVMNKKVSDHYQTEFQRYVEA